MTRRPVILVSLVILVGLAAACTQTARPSRSPQLVGLAVAHSDEVATLVKGKCSLCLRAGLRSTVTLEAPRCTGTYDEKGKFHAICVTEGSCSRGHSIRVADPGALNNPVPTGTITGAGQPSIGPPRNPRL